MNAATPYTLHTDILQLSGWVRHGNFSEVAIPACKSRRLVERLLQSGITPEIFKHLFVKSISATANDQLTSVIANRVITLQKKQDSAFATTVTSSAQHRAQTQQRISRFVISQNQSIQV